MTTKKNSRLYKRLRETALVTILALSPIPCMATATYEFIPDSIVGENSDWATRVKVQDSFTSGSTTWIFGSSEPQMVGVISLDFHPWGRLYTPTSLTGAVSDDWVFFSFTVVGDFLLGGYHAGGSLTEQWEGSTTSGNEWLVGFGSDGPFCYGNQSPQVIDDRPGYGNACRATGVFKKVAVPEPSTLGSGLN